MSTEKRKSPPPEVYRVALAMVQCGISVLPIGPGTKRPLGAGTPQAINWAPFQGRLPSMAELKHFKEGVGIGAIGGAVSGHLEILDFDDGGRCYPDWVQLVRDHDLDELLGKLPVARTPSGGYHVFYRCPEGVEGNQGLAKAPKEGAAGWKVLIETRGEGGYVCVAPTEGYRWDYGRFEHIPEISGAERAALLSLCRALDEMPFESEGREEEASGVRRQAGEAVKPWDWFNASKRWEEILEPHGWKRVGRSSRERATWVRPGKQARDGISATTGSGNDRLVVFSSNAPPFAANENYSKFGAWALLEHGGDLAKARAAVVEMMPAELRPGSGKQKTENGKRGDGNVGAPGSKAVASRQQEAKKPEVLSLTSMEDVEEVEVEWLWYPYLPLRRCTILEGDGDLGKSYMTCALAAAISLGRLPFGGVTLPEPGRVLMLASEDEADDTIKPRLKKFGADMTKVKHYGKLFKFDPRGLAVLRNTVAELRPLLVIIDPVLAYVGAAVNINAANEVRPIFDGLKSIASEFRCSMLNIRHTGKDATGKKAHHAGIGSGDIRNAHRSQLLVRWHPAISGLRVVTHEKHNLSEQGDAFGYEFLHGQFVWTQKVHVTEGEFLSAGALEPGALEQACEFLREELKEGLWVRSSDVQKRAKELGIAARTLHRARGYLKEELGIVGRKLGDGWEMRARNMEPPPPPLEGLE